MIEILKQSGKTYYHPILDNYPRYESLKAQESVIKEINSRLDENISVSDLDRTHRLGKPGGRRGPRPIIAKLLRHNDKARIFRKKKMLKGSRIMLTERLTPRRAVFLRYAREKFGGFNVWTRDGDIYIKSEDGISDLRTCCDPTKLKGDTSQQCPKCEFYPETKNLRSCWRNTKKKMDY